MSSIFQGNQERDIPVRQACTVLYDSLPDLTSLDFHAELEALVGKCTVDWAVVAPVAGAAADAPPVLGGVATFHGASEIEHRVAMVALNVAVRPEVLEVTVGVSPMSDDQRDAFMAHNGAIRLLYIGGEPDPVEQLTALYSVAGAALRLGGLGIINERAALAQPAEIVETLLPDLGSAIPPIQLWIGALTFSMEVDMLGNPTRYLLRTYGMDQCLLPELGMYVSDIEVLDTRYHSLINVCLYFIQERHGIPLGIGNHVEFGGTTYLLTEVTGDDWEYASSTGLLILVDV